MPIAFVEQTALTVSTTELSLISGTSTLQNDTTVCMMSVVIDGVANMAKGDEFLLKIYEKARSGGTKRVLFSTPIKNAQAELEVIPPVIVGNGWDVTLQKTAGTDRAFDTSIRKVS